MQITPFIGFSYEHVLLNKNMAIPYAVYMDASLHRPVFVSVAVMELLFRH